MSADEKEARWRKSADFANLVLADWDSAVGRFFDAVDEQREQLGMSDEDVRHALDIGYGDAVADAWTEYVGGGDE